MDSPIPIFKVWIPEWLIKLILFSLLLPNIVLFFLPLANVTAAAGYYGSEPADIQFSIVLFYAGYAGFYSLERRFFAYLAAKEYFILFTFLQMLCSWGLYVTDELYILFPIRFFQGMLFASTVNLALSLMFTRLKTERAREISFSVFFGLLLCAVPFNNLITADLIDSFDFNIIYKGALFSYLPCLVSLMISLNKVRLNVRFPLNKLDWQSFVLYSMMLCLIGYMLVYGQEYYWFGDRRICGSFIVLVLITIVYSYRQKSMKHPYLHFEIFSYRNFKVGLLVLFILYICRFASGITSSFFINVLRFDPFYLSYINLFNLCGLIIGVIVACCFILQKKRIRLIWLTGFVLLFAFHVIMYVLFDIQADEFNYFLPLLLQGIGVGLIMVPTIVFTIASVPTFLGPSSSALCLGIRYLGFCASISLVNYFELFGKSSHYNAFQDHLTVLDPVVSPTLTYQGEAVLYRGLNSSRVLKSSEKLLVDTVNKQGYLRFAMDYYELMSWILFITIIIISLIPSINRTIIYLKSRKLTPV